MSDNTFADMTLSEQIQVVNDRFMGNHPDRITQPSELFNVLGETVYIVLSPFGKDQDIGNGYIFDMSIDEIRSKDGEILNNYDVLSIDSLENPVCICNDDEFKALCLRDLNIIPNIYNNHAAFTTRDGAEAYAMFRKIQWLEEQSLIDMSNEFDFWMTDEQYNSDKKIIDKNKEK